MENGPFAMRTTTAPAWLSCQSKPDSGAVPKIGTHATVRKTDSMEKANTDGMRKTFDRVGADFSARSHPSAHVPAPSVPAKAEKQVVAVKRSRIGADFSVPWPARGYAPWVAQEARSLEKFYSKSAELEKHVGNTRAAEWYKKKQEKMSYHADRLMNDM